MNNSNSMSDASRQQMIHSLEGLRERCEAVIDTRSRQLAIEAQFLDESLLLRQEIDSHATQGVANKVKLSMSAFFLFIGTFLAIVSVFSHAYLSAVVVIAAGIVTLLDGWSRSRLVKLFLLVAAFAALNGASEFFAALSRSSGIGIVFTLVLTVLAAAGAWLTLRLALRWKYRDVIRVNREIQQQNQRSIADRPRRIAHNAELQTAFESTMPQMEQAIRELREYSQEHSFPPDYLSLSAVDSFIGSFRNFKADSIKDAVLEFDRQGRHEEMLAANLEIERINQVQVAQGAKLLSNQDTLIGQGATTKQYLAELKSGQAKMIGQLRTANLLGVANIAMQARSHAIMKQVGQDTTAAIQRTEQAIRGLARR